MAGFFDSIQNLTNDPQFQQGMGLLGAGMGNQPMVNAFTMLQAMKQRQLEAQQKQQQMELQKAEGERAQAQMKLYEQQVLGQQQHLKQIQKQQEMVQPFIQQMMNAAGGSQQQAPTQQPQSGPEMSQPGMMPTSFIQPTPQPPVEVGKYGTPKVILDNLQKIESNGNPFALGPDLGNGVKAQGAYQFLPTTVAQLKNEGVNFSPFDPVASRDAADYYLQKLVKQNGGDYQKALADYGGFKTKDASGYVSKVLTGSSEAQARQVTQLQAQGQLQQQTQQNFGSTPQAQNELAPHRAMTMAAGAIQALGDNPGAGLATMAGALKPETHKPGDIIIGPRGQVTQLPNPAQDVQLANEQTRIGLEAQRVKNETESRQATMAVQEQGQRLKLAKDTGMVGDTLAKTNLSVNAIDELLKHPGLNNITGAYAGLPPQVRRIFDPNGMNAQAALDSVKSQLLLQQLMSMKELSANGSSGFGQLSNVEGEQIRNSLGSLNESQTTEALTKNLRSIRDLLKNTAQRVRSVYKNSWGDQAQEVSPPQTANSGPVTLPQGWKVEQVK